MTTYEKITAAIIGLFATVTGAVLVDSNREYRKTMKNRRELEREIADAQIKLHEISIKNLEEAKIRCDEQQDELDRQLVSYGRLADRIDDALADDDES